MGRESPVRSGRGRRAAWRPATARTERAPRRAPRGRGPRPGRTADDYADTNADGCATANGRPARAGVYLDRVDTYESIKAPKGSSRAEMVRLVKEVADEARSRRSNAAVAVQNAEELLKDRDYVSTIDAIGKEDLYHGIRHDGRRNSKEAVRESERMLKQAKAQGKGVYVLEYVQGETARSVRSEGRRAGFVVSTTGRRDLKTASED